MKKRYMFTLTQSHFERCQSLMKDFGLEPGTLSAIVDTAVKTFADQMAHAKSKGAYTMTDLFTLIGQQMELLQDESNELPRRKRGRPRKEISA